MACLDRRSRQSLQSTCAVAESGPRYAKPLQHRLPEVIERRSGRIPKIAACPEGAASASQEQDGKVFVAVPIGIGVSASKSDHAVVEKIAIAFFDRLEFADEVGELLIEE